MAKLNQTDLDEIINSPDAFFSDPAKRVRALAVPTVDLQKQLADFAKIKNLDPAALVKSIITEIDL